MELFLVGETSLNSRLAVVKELARQSGFDEVICNLAGNHSDDRQTFYCMHLEIRGEGGNAGLMLLEALRLGGAYYDGCPECDKRKKWASVWEVAAEIKEGARLMSLISEAAGCKTRDIVC
jgi:hypothetical protein